MLCIHISRFSPGYLSKGLLKLINLLQCKYINKCYIYIYIIYVYIKVLSKLHFQRAAKTHQLVVVHTYISTDIYISKYFIYTYASRFSQGCVSKGRSKPPTRCSARVHIYKCYIQYYMCIYHVYIQHIRFSPGCAFEGLLKPVNSL